MRERESYTTQRYTSVWLQIQVIPNDMFILLSADNQAMVYSVTYQKLIGNHSSLFKYEVFNFVIYHNKSLRSKQLIRF